MEYREEVHMRRYKRKCDIFFGIEHRLTKGDMEEQFNKEAKEGWRFAAEAARITDERAGSEDQKAYIRRSLCCVRQQPESSCGSRRRSD